LPIRFLSCWTGKVNRLQIGIETPQNIENENTITDGQQKKLLKWKKTEVSTTKTGQGQNCPNAYVYDATNTLLSSLKA